MVNSKAKAGEKTVTDSFETAMKSGSDAFKSEFDKVVNSYDRFFDYGRETLEAYVKAANAAGKGVETLHNEIYAWSRQSFADSVSAAKAVFGSRSVHEALELQGDFVKSSFETYVGEVTRLGEIAFATAKETIVPLQGRAQAWVDAVDSSRGA
ncbi:MAG TPA: TIGR01841 family phasin [Rhizomicrobium sp.]|jgi:phasin family protein